MLSGSVASSLSTFYSNSLPHLMLWVLVGSKHSPERSTERSTGPPRLGSLPRVNVDLHPVPAWGRPHRTFHCTRVPSFGHRELTSQSPGARSPRGVSNPPLLTSFPRPPRLPRNCFPMSLVVPDLSWTCPGFWENHVAAGSVTEGIQIAI